MAEGTYEYECMRAELLGIDKPEYDEFLKKQKENESQEVQNEEIDTEHLKGAEAQNEELQNVGGKLEELNNLLSMTQKKINNFKYRCNSVTSYMKSRLGNWHSSNSLDSSSIEAKKIEEEDDDNNVDSSHQPEQQDNTPNPIPLESQRKSDLAKALDRNSDRLDTMLDKADNAHYSMQYQRSQMQSLLK
ncbi:hypothetical protein MML48_9g00002403 [Holotrichia oblita]|uniref:Uncharacterized protein n=1 Tax=Holotrichia oblita TaxID=644536 RepID=A0ACB9SH55_HOLOL|nr:hypothetical protein MML48_9g00002403 [Holotrichia oblita]